MRPPWHLFANSVAPDAKKEERIDRSSSCRPLLKAAKRCTVSLNCRGPSACHRHNRAHQEQRQEHDEKNLGDAGCCRGDPAKAEYCGNDGNHQECQSPMEHGHTSLFFRIAVARATAADVKIKNVSASRKFHGN